MKIERLRTFLILIITFDLLFAVAGLAKADANAVEYFDMGKKEFGLKNYDKAIEDIQQAITIDPQNSLFQLKLANYLMDLKRYQDSINEFNAVIAANPQGNQYYMANFGLGFDYLSLKKPIESVNAFNIAAFKHPIEDNLLHLVAFRFMLLHHDGEFLNYIDNVLGKRPLDAGYWKEKGGILIHLGKVDEAEKAYETAISLFQKKGDMKKADWFTHALSDLEKS